MKIYIGILALVLQTAALLNSKGKYIKQYNIVSINWGTLLVEFNLCIYSELFKLKTGFYYTEYYVPSPKSKL